MRELQGQISEDRRRIAIGDRPTYHATWSTSLDGGAVDVGIRELPIIHLFVPNESGVLAGARVLIARTLGVEQSSFDVRADA